MSFARATAADGVTFLLVGLYLSWLAFRPVSKRVAADPVKLRRYMRFRELFTFAGPAIVIISALFILAKLTM